MYYRRPPQTSSGASTPRWSSSSSTTLPSYRRRVPASRHWAQRSCCWLSAGSNRREPTLLLPRRTEEEEEQEARRPGEDKQEFSSDLCDHFGASRWPGAEVLFCLVAPNKKQCLYQLDVSSCDQFTCDFFPLKTFVKGPNHINWFSDSHKKQQP